MKTGDEVNRVAANAVVDTSAPAACRLVRASGSYTGKQGLDYFEGISRETVGSTGICMHLLTLPPGARARVHMHENHETAVYVLSGEASTWYGEKLEQHFIARAGDMVYIPAGTPHVPANLGVEPCTAVIARTDPHEQESVVLLPHLEELVPVPESTRIG
ncbi:cupin domain-containing protein [Aquisalimonas sp.]|uniref:cupin domain-containing protein n=1 Tax=Aquisalimonas sp. TaxID=1872621 RepID=UPI0025BB8AD8|nr:cupin domain-containing protein [Aquisalimonas sp.]